MTVTRDGKFAVISDPDRDRIMMVDLADKSKITELKLNAGDEPGRVIEDGAGRLHVALRRGGDLVTFSTAGEIVARRAVCAEPRGLAWDSATDVVHVACATGELVTFPAAAGNPVRLVNLGRDLRDVIVTSAGLRVTTFKKAEVLSVDATGAITSRVVSPTVKRLDISGMGGGDLPPQTDEQGLVDAIPAVAWRTIGLADGRLLMVHQRQVQAILKTKTEGGYGPGCGQGPDEAAVTVIDQTTGPQTVRPFMRGALPVDIAATANGSQIAIITAGDGSVHRASNFALSQHDDDQCGGGGGEDERVFDDLGAPTSVAYTPTNELLIYYPELPALAIHGAIGAQPAIVTLPGPLGYDSGRSLFHRQTSVGLACASCHPEGREDGLVWQFDIGVRRTQNLSGKILARAPYHWTGDMTDLPVLMTDVFGKRMAGGELTASEKKSLGPWLDRLPAPAPIVATDVAAVERGQALFESVETQCTTCHRGEILSTKQMLNVGTGMVVKVPSLLGIGARAPFMHDGCAKTLADRFTAPCGGGDLHGHTSQLTPAQVADLVAYLETL